MPLAPSFFPPASPPLAPYATAHARSRGRLHPESDSRLRTPFQRDRDRIIHSVAFRRLEYKTQVFINHEGDHYRTRLTHSLEVAQIARVMARALKVDEDLTETLALAHDLGHPPFGHTGEDVLDECMQDYGGFDHNAQTLRVVTLLERHYENFDGLNLTWETLEGLVKHNGPLEGDLPRSIVAYGEKHDLELSTHAGLEAQLAAQADDIAYNNHDMDDGLRAGLFEVKDLLPLPLVGKIFREEGTGERAVFGAVRRLIGEMVSDLVDQTGKRLEAANPASAEAVRSLDYPLAGFSESMTEANEALRGFLQERMYKHDHVNRERDKSRRLLRELFDLYFGDPKILPADWRKMVEESDNKTAKAVHICDFIAGMTDRFAIKQHRLRFNQDLMAE